MQQVDASGRCMLRVPHAGPTVQFHLQGFLSTFTSESLLPPPSSSTGTAPAAALVLQLPHAPGRYVDLRVGHAQRPVGEHEARSQQQLVPPRVVEVLGAHAERHRPLLASVAAYQPLSPLAPAAASAGDLAT